MSCPCLLNKSLRLTQNVSTRAASSSSSRKSFTPKGPQITAKKPTTNLRQLQSILNNMRVVKNDVFFRKIDNYGRSDMFGYATNEQYSRDDLKYEKLKVWDRLYQDKLQRTGIRLPLSGFDELIRLTEEGKIWKYPIDNEQGLEAEKEVPFEDHVFMDHLLEKFPKNEQIQNVMSLVIAGLAKNHWMTVERKHSIIQFYLDYFEEKREIYKQSGYEI